MTNKSILEFPHMISRAIQRRALENGIPYQDLVASILHKYVSGCLYDVTANKPINSDG